jgi:hypothetical protein
MITGKGFATGKYSYHVRHFGMRDVYVQHLPEQTNQVRIVFRDKGETAIPTIALDLASAEALWAALSGMAKDLEWKDYEASK